MYDCRPKFLPLIQQRCCVELVAVPGIGWETIFHYIPIKGDAIICFPPGKYPLFKPLSIADKGRLRLVGSGSSSRIYGKTSEIVLLFENCASVEIEDLHLHGGQPSQKHLGGTLSFKNVRNVELDSISVRCMPSNSRTLSCIHVENDYNSISNRCGRVSVSNCEFYIGHLQVGILVLNSKSIIRIYNNRFMPSGPTLKKLKYALRDIRFLENLAHSGIIIPKYDDGIKPSIKLMLQ